MTTQSLLPTALNWLWPRFLIYVEIALAAALAFVAWAAVYTYVWPGPPPVSVSSPPEIQKPAPTPATLPPTPSTDDGPAVANIPPSFLGAAVSAPDGTTVGHIVKIDTNSVLVRSQADVSKIVAVPYGNIEWRSNQPLSGFILKSCAGLSDCPWEQVPKQMPGTQQAPFSPPSRN